MPQIESFFPLLWPLALEGLLAARFLQSQEPPLSCCLDLKFSKFLPWHSRRYLLICFFTLLLRFLILSYTQLMFSRSFAPSINRKHDSTCSRSRILQIEPHSIYETLLQVQRDRGWAAFSFLSAIFYFASPATYFYFCFHFQFYFYFSFYLQIMLIYFITLPQYKSKNQSNESSASLPTPQKISSRPSISLPSFSKLTSTILILRQSEYMSFNSSLRPRSQGNYSSTDYFFGVEKQLTSSSLFFSLMRRAKSLQKQTCMRSMLAQIVASRVRLGSVFPLGLTQSMLNLFFFSISLFHPNIHIKIQNSVKVK